MIWAYRQSWRRCCFRIISSKTYFKSFQRLCPTEPLSFLLYEKDLPVGFAQCQLHHDYVEGTETTPIGYLEGIFVKEGYRNRGYARELLTAYEAWVKRKGCHEFASDCEIHNISGFRFHKAMNFAEANRIICLYEKIVKADFRETKQIKKAPVSPGARITGWAGGGPVGRPPNLLPTCLYSSPTWP